MNDKAPVARGWFQKADSDLAAGNVLLTSGGPFDSACFHAQQAVEKYLKGILTLAGSQFPFTHNLEQLQQIGEANIPGWPFKALALDELTSYAVQIRYDFEFWPDQETAAQALELAEEVRSRTMKFAPEDAHPRKRVSEPSV